MASRKVDRGSNGVTHPKAEGGGMAEVGGVRRLCFNFTTRSDRVSYNREQCAITFARQVSLKGP